MSLPCNFATAHHIIDCLVASNPLRFPLIPYRNEVLTCKLASTSSKLYASMPLNKLELMHRPPPDLPKPLPSLNPTENLLSD